MKAVLRKWGFAVFFSAIIALVAVEAGEAAEAVQDVTALPGHVAVAAWRN